MKLALNERSEVAARWSREKPSRPGYYWLRFLPQDRDLGTADIVCVEPDLRVVLFYDEEGPHDLDSDLFESAEWCGPLFPPRSGS